jgi:glycine betaine/proline transport system substrate-binding protein
MTSQLANTGLATALVGGVLAMLPVAAQELPGQGTTVQPIASTIAEEQFQALIIMRGLEELGYQVEKPKETQIQLAHVAVGQGDADYYSAHWHPLHIEFFEQAGGADQVRKVGTLVEGSLQGYLVDKKTAEEYGIKNVKKLQDPKIAKLFDTDGDGTADLYGCEPGWGCERVIEHQLDAYDLHEQGAYFAIMADAISRYEQGKPIFYYTWTPLWVSAILVPREDVSWLEVPFTSLPEEQEGVETTVEGLGNLGFAVNSQHVLAGTAFLEENPAAERWFELLEIPLKDINAQNLKMREGEDAQEDIRRHVDQWIEANENWDTWIEEARKAGQEG